MDYNAQVSLELIIIIGVLLTVLALMSGILLQTGSEAANVFKDKSRTIFDGIEEL